MQPILPGDKGIPFLQLPKWVWLSVAGVATIMAIIQPSLVIAYAILAFVIWKLRKDFRNRQNSGIELIKRYANANNFTYKGNQSRGDVPLTLFATRPGSHITRSFMLAGEINEHMFKMYSFVGSAAPDDSGNFRTFDIVEIGGVESPKKLLILSRQSGQSSPALLSSWRQAHLEGDFGQVFTVYTDGPQSAHVQEILEPNLMHLLMQDYPDLSFELDGEKLVVLYADYDIPYSPDTAERMLGAAKLFLEKTGL